MGRIKRWLILVAGVVVALILGVLIGGLLLPEEHHASRACDEAIAASDLGHH